MTQRSYIHEHPDWPRFHWDWSKMALALAVARYRQGLLLGRVESLGPGAQQEMTVDTLTTSVVSSIRIERETIDPEEVRASVARQLGLEVDGAARTDASIDGMVGMTVDAAVNYDKPLTRERLFDWHRSLYPTGFNKVGPIAVGKWRSGAAVPMRIVSNMAERQDVHFEAPPAAALDNEMEAFIDWFERPDGSDMVIKAAVAHLWFIAIYPFDDGNGPIARALTDMVLARSDGTSQRSYSMAETFHENRLTYYRILAYTEGGELDITDWFFWFLKWLKDSIEASEDKLAAALSKARFWRTHQQATFNDRQRAMLQRLLDGLEEELTVAMWANLTYSSRDTALRDITALIDHGILVRNPGGGRRTSYGLLPELPPGTLGLTGRR